MLRTARSLLRTTGRHLAESGWIPGENAMKNRSVVSTSRQCSTTNGSNEQIESSKTPRRAVLYVPGHSEKMLKKLTDLKVDCAVMECEDGVAVNKKVQTILTLTLDLYRVVQSVYLKSDHLELYIS